MDLTNLNKDRKVRRKAGNLDLGTMMYGKIPPQAKGLEEAILGGILLGHGGFDIVNEILTPESFYVEANQRIFRGMRAMAQKSMPIDILTMVEQLKTSEELDLVGGPYYVNKLTNTVVSTAHIESHCRIIMQKFIQRELIRIGGEMIGDAYEDSTDVFDLLSESENSIAGITTNYIKKDFSTIDKGLVKVMQKIEELRQKDTSLTGVPTGYPELDQITHGWQPSDLIILAARPSVGKTAFALNIARKAAMHHSKPTAIGFFSLEMSEGQLITRILSAESQIELTKLTTGSLDDAQMKILYLKGVTPLSSAPICIDDTAGLNMFELRAKARRMKNKYGVGLIIIDYLQLMSSDKDKRGNREQEISNISRELKKLAKDLNLPIIALSQLSREVEKRGKGQKQPQLSDLRESGALEQDADVVIFLYRPPEDEVAQDAELKNKGWVKIAKHRNGVLGEFAFVVSNNVQTWSERGAISKDGFQPIQTAHQQQLGEIFITKGSKMKGDDDEPGDDLPF